MYINTYNKTTNWHGIKNIANFNNLKYIKDNNSYVKVLDAVKQRLEKLQTK